MVNCKKKALIYFRRERWIQVIRQAVFQHHANSNETMSLFFFCVCVCACVWRINLPAMRRLLQICWSILFPRWCLRSDNRSSMMHKTNIMRCQFFDNIWHVGALLGGLCICVNKAAGWEGGEMEVKPKRETKFSIERSRFVGRITLHDDSNGQSRISTRTIWQWGWRTK